MPSRKTWIITLPSQLKEEVRVYGVRKSLRIWETVDRAIEKYFEAAEITIEPALSDMEPQEDWSIQIDHDKYKQLKLLSVSHEVSVYDLINTALYRLVYDKAS